VTSPSQILAEKAARHAFHASGEKDFYRIVPKKAILIALDPTSRLDADEVAGGRESEPTRQLKRRTKPEPKHPSRPVRNPSHIRIKTLEVALCAGAEKENTYRIAPIKAILLPLHPTSRLDAD